MTKELIERLSLYANEGVQTDAARITQREAADALKALQAENEQLRELMNTYNVGGWTDSLQLIKERDALAAKLLELSKVNGGQQ